MLKVVIYALEVLYLNSPFFNIAFYQQQEKKKKTKWPKIYCRRSFLATQMAISYLLKQMTKS